VVAGVALYIFTDDFNHIAATNIKFPNPIDPGDGLAHASWRRRGRVPAG
jgi:hypothetical protein